MIDRDEIYYQALAVADRMYEALIDKYDSLGKAGQEIRNQPPFYATKQNQAWTPRLDTLAEAAALGKKPIDLLW